MMSFDCLVHCWVVEKVNEWVHGGWERVGVDWGLFILSSASNFF